MFKVFMVLLIPLSSSILCAAEETVTTTTNGATDFQSYLSSFKGLLNWDLISLEKFALVILSFVAALILNLFFILFVDKVLIKYLTSKTETDIDDVFCRLIKKPSKGIALALAALVSIFVLKESFAPEIYSILTRISLAVAAGYFFYGLYLMIDVLNLILTNIASRSDNNIDDLVVAVIRSALKVAVIAVAVIFIGQNILNLKITAILAGAGVFGLAIAFAAQDTIANFFGSLMVILDRPFKVGDRIKLVGYEAFVEAVGFRSTKMRTLDGHLVTVPNKEIADSSVENISARPFIRTTINLGLVYDTPAEKMELAVKILHEIFDNHAKMSKEHEPLIVFNSFNDWSLNIMVMLWYHTEDWFDFQRWNSEKNFEVLKKFNDAGLEFAFPTNTTYHAFDPNRKLQFVVESKNQQQSIPALVKNEVN